MTRTKSQWLHLEKPVCIVTTLHFNLRGLKTNLQRPFAASFATNQTGNASNQSAFVLRKLATPRLRFALAFATLF